MLSNFCAVNIFFDVLASGYFWQRSDLYSKWQWEKEGFAPETLLRYCIQWNSCGFVMLLLFSIGKVGMMEGRGGGEVKLAELLSGMEGVQEVGKWFLLVLWGCTRHPEQSSLHTYRILAFPFFFHAVLMKYFQWYSRWILFVWGGQSSLRESQINGYIYSTRKKERCILVGDQPFTTVTKSEAAYLNHCDDNITGADVQSWPYLGPHIGKCGQGDLV